MSVSIEKAMSRAKAHEKKREFEHARQIYAAILQKFPNNARARKAFEAIGGARQGIDLPSEHAQPLIDFMRQGNFEQVLSAFRKLEAGHPDSAFLFDIAGMANAALGRLDDAETCFRRALAINPRLALAHNNLGTVLYRLGRLDEAGECYATAVGQNPGMAEAHNNLGLVLHGRREYAQAVAAYGKAIGIKPGYSEAHNNLGNALRDMGRSDAAAESYARAIEIDPKNAEAHYNIAVIFQQRGAYGKSASHCDEALRTRPNYTKAKLERMIARAHMCDWRVYEDLVDSSSAEDIARNPFDPFVFLALEDNPERQLLRSRSWARGEFEKGVQPQEPEPAAGRGRIRVGYFSSDFHNHATMYLMSGLFRHHDKSRFEIFAYSAGKTKTGEMRDRLLADVDRFVDIEGMSERDVVEMARGDGLDIAIDLKGYTKNTVSGLFPYRLAPVQVNYLGYPGTLAMEAMDYIVADPVVIPDAQREFYSESVIYLPDTYQPNDDTREIAAADTTRADFGLPEDAFVFCCFNNTHKIGPREFDIWMRILAQIPGSVLWLFGSNALAEENLRKEAAARGVDPARLVFAGRLPHDEHLARHKHADLFIDTFSYNAHTTASDALWAGLPVVTMAGKQFAARVAASLLHALGMPELVTEGEDAYETLISDLARDPERLAAIRAKLAQQRTSQPLFDSARYTRDFERGLELAHERRLKGLEPADIRVVSTP